MSEMADRSRPLELPDVPEGEQVSTADVAERVDEEPDEQENRVDPVWRDASADGPGGGDAEGRPSEA